MESDAHTTMGTPDFDLFQVIGGEKTCLALAEAFYARVPHDPVLRNVYSPGYRCAIESLGTFFVQFLGGPTQYSDRRWSLSLREAHARFKIGPAERSAWLTNIERAMDEVGIVEPARSALQEFFAMASAGLLNTPASAVQTGTDLETTSVASQPTASEPISQEIGRRAEDFRAIELVVAAVRAGNSAHAIALAETPRAQCYFARDPGALLSLLAIMSGRGAPDLTRYVLDKLSSDPQLAHQRYTYGRTLLHEVGAEGSVPVVKRLLELGADPNTLDEYGHSPLYFVGNACSAPNGPEAVGALVRGGANPNSQDTVKRCTPLHMAARRGNIAVAAALLDSGASLEVPDSAGDTPLRRAVNCGKTELAALLLSRGADVHSKGSKGLAPWQAARSAAMKQLVRQYYDPVKT